MRKILFEAVVRFAAIRAADARQPVVRRRGGRLHEKEGCRMTG
jgi:hypothetical protein